MTMTPLRHALAARMLIKACGGLELSAEASRLSKTQLANFQDAERVQDPERARFMPADVIYELEELCGQKIYTRMLMGETARPDPNATLLGEACAMVEASSKALKTISDAVADGEISPAERRQIEASLLNLAQLLARTSAASVAAGGRS